MRAFIAIELPIAIKDALSKIQDKLEAEKLQINWVKSQNLHLTLKFLGDISSEQLIQIKQLITEITKTASGFKIKLETLGVFPNAHAPRIVWIGTNQPPLELKQLAQQLETRLPVSGIPREGRSFHAHITIGRIKSRLIPSDLEKAFDKVEKDVINASWELECGRITLFESTLGPGGPTYTVLGKFKIT
jgi:2'-5' RNA ligase